MPWICNTGQLYITLSSKLTLFSVLFSLQSRKSNFNHLNLPFSPLHAPISPLPSMQSLTFSILQLTWRPWPWFRRWLGMEHGKYRVLLRLGNCCDYLHELGAHLRQYLQQAVYLIALSFQKSFTMDMELTISATAHTRASSSVVSCLKS